MALQINTNLGAMVAAASASSVNKSMQTSMERLSSGLRINKASDDAAGSAIASRLTSEIRGTAMAIRNASDGQALIDTAEGAHKEIVNILQRMREIAVQGANDTNDATDRSNLQAEMNALASEIDRIASVTTWAGISLLNEGEEGEELQFHIGANTNEADEVTITIEDMEAATLGVEAAEVEVDEYENAESAIEAIDEAIETVNESRANLGASSNRLDHTISNLTNVMINLEAGKSRILDADFAAESTNLAKTQILQQASTAMLSQANASKQTILALLQG